MTAVARGIAELLADARSRIARYTPAQAQAEEDVVLVDLRSHDERAATGIIPGSIHVPRTVLEWRCDPQSGWSNANVADRSLLLVLVCAHGYSSSFAAAALVELGFGRAGDMDGGFEAWRDAGLAVVPAPQPEQGLPGMGGPQ
jgi:rhodanese-related sulfurtransferase